MHNEKAACTERNGAERVRVRGEGREEEARGALDGARVDGLGEHLGLVLALRLPVQRIRPQLESAWGVLRRRRTGAP